MPNDIAEMRKYFSGLNLSQKKKFTLKLKGKLETLNSSKHRQLLEECIRLYNAEIRTRNKEVRFTPKEPKMPNISPDTFARALATLIHGMPKKPTLIGKWQREPNDGGFYYKFNSDGTFETNEFEGFQEDGILKGNYTIGIDNVVLMEPHEKLKFTGILFSQGGNSMIILLKDGLTLEYGRGFEF